MQRESNPLVFAADLAGTFVFAMEGALTAIGADLDLLGIMVLAFATALGGGVARDLLIGAVPPQAIRDWRYSVVAFSAAGFAFSLNSLLRELPPQVLIDLDAAGLALFSVAGTEKALAYRMHPFIAAMMGTITGVGGGTVRDMLLAHVPAVLRVDIYATAALLGALVIVIGRGLGVPRAPAAIAGGLACITLRLLAVWHHWQLPHATPSPGGM
jgi:uncharacterized membrane protein YeiH